MAMAALPLLGAAGTAGAGAMGTLSTIATIASIGSSLVSGFMGMQAGAAEAAQIKQQQQMEKTRAMQEEANRQANLTRILAEGMAMSAGRGGVIGSGSDIAVSDFSMEEANRESGIAKLESKYQQQRLSMQASQAKRSGVASLISGVSGALSTAGTYAEKRYERTPSQKPPSQDR
jgi:hypothetical protein